MGEMPASDGVCDSCGGEVYQRDDDNVEAATQAPRRLRALTSQLAARLLRGQGLLREIDGDRPVDVVFADVRAALEARADPVIVRKSAAEIETHARGRARQRPGSSSCGRGGPSRRHDRRARRARRGGHPRSGGASRVHGLPRLPDDTLHLGQRAGRPRHPLAPRSFSSRATSFSVDVGAIFDGYYGDNAAHVRRGRRLRGGDAAARCNCRVARCRHRQCVPGQAALRHRPRGSVGGRGRGFLGGARVRRTRHRAQHARGPQRAELRPGGQGPELEAGMVLAIEPMVNAGGARRGLASPTAGPS